MEQAVNSSFGLISIDTSTAADSLSLPALFVRVYWYKEVRDRSPDDPQDWEPHAEITGVSSQQQMPLQELLPFVERPLGLLAIPSPKNPLFYLNRFYNSANPFCAAMMQQEKAAAAAAAAIAAAQDPAAGGSTDGTPISS